MIVCIIPLSQDAVSHYISEELIDAKLAAYGKFSILNCLIYILGFTEEFEV